MTTGFGALDGFGLADTNWKQQGGSVDPSASEAQAPAENGDIACSTVHGAVTALSTTYLWCGGSTLTYPATLTGLGILLSTNVVTGIKIETSNTEKPKLTVSGYTWVGAVGGPENVYTLTLPAITGKKASQDLGITPAAGSTLTSSSYDATVDLYQAPDEGGDVAAMEVSKGRIEVSASLVSCTGIPGATAASGYTLKSVPSSATTNTGYATGSASAFKNLAADVPV